MINSSLRLVVAADGSGDFPTVQSALDSIPEGNSIPTTILLRNGVYAEIVRWQRGKNCVTLRGEDRRRTVIAAMNNETMNSRSSNRALFVIEGDDCILENLTLINTTPKSDAQAEALKVDADRVILRHASFFSFQDTLMLNGRVYMHHCLVAGDVDFIWGFGTAYIEQCEIRARHAGYNVQARNPNDKMGYVFVDCNLTKEAHVRGHFLGRTGKGADHVAYVNCRMDDHIVPEGWDGENTGVGWWEYDSVDLHGKLLDVTHRRSSRQLNCVEAKQLRNISYVLKGWQPETL